MQIITFSVGFYCSILFGVSIWLRTFWMYNIQIIYIYICTLHCLGTDFGPIKNVKCVCKKFGAYDLALHIWWFPKMVIFPNHPFWDPFLIEIHGFGDPDFQYMPPLFLQQCSPTCPSSTLRFGDMRKSAWWRISCRNWPSARWHGSSGWNRILGWYMIFTGKLMTFSRELYTFFF